MLDHPEIDVETGIDFFAHKDQYLTDYPKIVFTGMIDQYFGLKSIFETDFKRHSEPRLPSTAQINH